MRFGTVEYLEHSFFLLSNFQVFIADLKAKLGTDDAKVQRQRMGILHVVVSTFPDVETELLTKMKFDWIRAGNEGKDKFAK